jgi:hypothetical protein
MRHVGLSSHCWTSVDEAPPVVNSTTPSEFPGPTRGIDERET